ncbi:MAG: large conductance mechanosensitive channel protein MscL [Planctomycetaceae bacterium]
MEPLKKITELKSAQATFSLYEEFKKFAFKGNVIDLAVGVIIGGAFGKIIASLVENIIMPVVGMLMPSQQGYQKWIYYVGDKEIPYGKFIGEVVNFLIVAMVLFIFIVKFLGWVTRSRETTPAAPPVPTKDQILLTEIRDLLKAKSV